MGGHVAAAAGIGVVPPGAAEVGGLLEDSKVVAALLEERDPHAEAAEARPEDRNSEVAAGSERRRFRLGLPHHPGACLGRRDGTRPIRARGPRRIVRAAAARSRGREGRTRRVKISRPARRTLPSSDR